MTALKELAISMIEEGSVSDLQKLSSEIISDNTPVPNVNELLPIDAAETATDEFEQQDLSEQEFRTSPFTDKLKNLAKMIIGVPGDTTVSLTKKAPEDLEIGEENIGFFPSSGEEAAQAAGPALTLLSSPVTLSTNGLLAIAGDDPKKRLKSIARIALLQPEEGDELFVGDMLKEFGITDEKLDEIVEPIIGPGFFQTAGFREKIGFMGDIIGFSKFDGILKKLFTTGDSTAFTTEMARRIREAKDAKLAAGQALSAFTKQLEKANKEFGGAVKKLGKEDGFAGFESELLTSVKQLPTAEIPAELSKHSKKDLINLSGEVGITINKNMPKDAIIQKLHTVGFANPRGMSLLRGGKNAVIIGAGVTAGLALMEGEAEAGIGSIAKKVIQFPGKAAKKTIDTLDPLTKFPQKPINKLANGFRVHELVKTRVFNINEANLKSEAFISKFTASLTKKEREALPFIREGAIQSPAKLKEALAQIGKSDLFDIIKDPSAEVLKFNEMLGKYYDDAHKMLSENFDNVNFLNEYVNRIWDIPKSRKNETANFFATKNPFLQKRKIPTLLDGIKLGLKPKTLDIADLLHAYDQYKINTIFNNRFAKALKSVTDAETGVPLIVRNDKNAPAHWKEVSHPALDRAMAIGQTKDGGPILKKISVKVHPEIADEVIAIFSHRIGGRTVNTFETINAFLKKSQLSFSFFHHFALTESAFSSGIGPRAMKLWNPYKVFKAVKNNDFEVFRRMPAAIDAVQHGVTFGPLSDFMVTRVKNGLESIERGVRNIPVVGKAAKIVNKANDLWDKTLWDYYHNTLKLYAYESQVATELKRAAKKLKRDLTPNETREIKESIGDFVNNSFGGQNWDLQPFFRHPKNRQMMQWAFLSPDWTTSVLKQAFAPIKGHRQAVAAGSIERRLAGKALSKRAHMFWIKAMVYYNLIANSANIYNTTKWQYIDGKPVATFNGEPRLLWENSVGNKLNIFNGFDDDGHEKYVRMGKQFREVMEYSYEPEKKLGAKLSPALRALLEQVTKVQAGSGFPTSFKDLDFWESWDERAKTAFMSLVPFSFRAAFDDNAVAPFMAALPQKKGMTGFRAVQEFKQAMLDGDAAREVEIGMSALRNSLNADKLRKRASSILKGDDTRGVAEIARWVRDSLRKYPDDAKGYAWTRMVEEGWVTPEVEARLEKMAQERDNIQMQRRAVGLE